MKKYLAHDSINGEFEDFETIEQAREWLEEAFLCDNEYHPDLKDCAIYTLAETVDYKVIDKKSNYEYENEENIPEGDTESQAWPFDNSWTEVWKHKFIPVGISMLKDIPQGAKQITITIQETEMDGETFLRILRTIKANLPDVWEVVKEEMQTNLNKLSQS